MLLRPVVWMALACAVLATGCDAEAEPAADPGTSMAGEPSSLPRIVDEAGASLSRPAPPLRAACREDLLEDRPAILLTGSDPVTLAQRVAARTHRCAHAVVVAPVDGWAASLAVPVALAADVPLLLVDPEETGPLRTMLAELDVDSVITVGIPVASIGFEGIELLGTDPQEPDTTADPDSPAPGDDPDGDSGAADEQADDAIMADISLALAVADHLGTRTFVAVHEHDVRGRTAAALHVDASEGLLPIPTERHNLAVLAASLPPNARLRVVDAAAARTTTQRLLGVGIDAEILDGERWPDGGSTSWLIDPDAPEIAAVAAVAAAGRGEAVLPVDRRDLRAGAANAARLRAAAPQRAVLVGDMTAHALWQLEVVRDGPSLPGGGFRLFEDERLVAIHGSPDRPELGALGEQDLDATVVRLRELAGPYGADGLRVLPGFSLVANTAGAGRADLGGDGEHDGIHELRTYADRAAQEGFYVVLDVHPGHMDVLEQVQGYEELLLEPHVGIALTVDWRVETDESQGDGVSVSKQEAQSVANWLASLARANRLPQKLLVLRQLEGAPPPDTSDFTVSPELAAVLLWHGQDSDQGGLEASLGNAAGHVGDWPWGWHVPLVERELVPTPEHLLTVQPPPAVITYE